MPGPISRQQQENFIPLGAAVLRRLGVAGHHEVGKAISRKVSDHRGSGVLQENGRIDVFLLETAPPLVPVDQVLIGQNHLREPVSVQVVKDNRSSKSRR